MKLRQHLISGMRTILGDTNTYQIKCWMGYPMSAFHNDRICQILIDQLIKSFQVTVFAETGTYRGQTTRLMAVKYRKLTIHSFEVNETFYKDSLRKLQAYKNVYLHLGSSEKVMGEMLKMHQLGDRPLFYLDAHWYDYWPLCDEIKLISNHLG